MRNRIVATVFFKAEWHGAGALTVAFDPAELARLMNDCERLGRPGAPGREFRLYQVYGADGRGAGRRVLLPLHQVERVVCARRHGTAPLTTQL